MSARELQSDDRCSRKSFLEAKWDRRTLSASDVLRRSIEAGLESDDADPGQVSGDEAMSLCVDRGLEVNTADLYSASVHIAALADMIVWLVRGDGGPWARPEDVKIGNQSWRSSCFLSESGTRLRQVICVDRWDDNRELSTLHSWFYTGETSAYQMPMDLTVVVTGQRRDAKWHGPLSAGWLHPVNSALRMRKRDGKGFDGDWKKTFREDSDLSREKWLDALTADGVLTDVIIPHEIPVHDEVTKIRRLMGKKLESIRETSACPDPQPSQCDGISPCYFRSSCWNFEMPTIQDGFIRIKS